MGKSRRIGFDDMPGILESLVSEVKGLRAAVDSLLISSPKGDVSTNQLLTTNEVCILLGKTRVSVYRMVKRGDLVAYKKGKNLFFLKDEILSGLVANKVGGDV